jgi:cell wall-associated NlpC family hydrolase
MLLLAACAAIPERPAAVRGPSPPSPLPSPAATAPRFGDRLVTVAQSLLGAPYRYGGASPSGFDCSGLVYFAYAELGIAVPRTVAAQKAAVRPVAEGELAPGDLVFFHVGGAGIDHVGIYAGGGRFIHAPARGRTVTWAALDEPFYARRYAGAGRFAAPVAR